MRNSTLYGTLDLVDRFLVSLRELGPRSGAAEVLPTDGAGTRIRWQAAGASLTFALDVTVSAITTSPEADSSNARAVGDDIPIVVAPYIARAAQISLESRGISYWDPTGNVLIQNRNPLVWIRSDGSTKNPTPSVSPTTLQSLKGKSASEVIVRLLADGGAATVRDLARESGASLGTASRVITLLRNEDLLAQTDGGRIVVNDPVRLVRRWAEDYSFEKTFKARRYFSILGSTVSLERVRESEINYALTGLAAQTLWYEENAKVAPLPSSELWLYTDDVERLEKVADLVPDSLNGNIMIAKADFLGAEREGYREGTTRTAWPWRVVGDLLSLSGRYSAAGSDFAEELIASPTSPYA